MITLPGFIDPHVHLRDPGQTEKEDFYTGTASALAGGYTTIIDMPNNLAPITTKERLEEKIKIAKEKIVCDVGFYFGSIGDNIDEFPKVEKETLGIKVYLNQTTGNYIVTPDIFRKIAIAWTNETPILVHAEENILKEILEIGNETKQKIHVCHVNSQKELEIIMRAKDKRYEVTCGVTPHHLFLTESNLNDLGNLGKVKPPLKSQKDIDFLWQNLDKIDVIESDHAPHTIEEKQSENPPVGVPGLETTLPLLLTAASQDKLTIDDIKRLCHDNPRKIFFPNPSNSSYPSNPSTYIQVDENEEWTINNEKLFTKCKWSPFNGWEMKGKIKQVIIRKTKVFENDKILAKPGFGKVITG